MSIPPDITAITLGVRDVERSRAFYVDGLGFRSVLHLAGDRPRGSVAERAQLEP